MRTAFSKLKSTLAHLLAHCLCKLVEQQEGGTTITLNGKDHTVNITLNVVCNHDW